MVDEFEVGLEWEGKMDFVLGVFEDFDVVLELFYQVLFGRVYILIRWWDGFMGWGEVQLIDFEVFVGGLIIWEGWYDVLGKYLGVELFGFL